MPKDRHDAHILLPAVSTTLKPQLNGIVAIDNLLWMRRKPLTSIQHDHITLNNPTVPFLKIVLLHAVAPVSHWPWLESLWEQATLSQHEAITSWLRHDRCEPSNFPHFWLAQWDSSRFPSPEPERSLWLQTNCPQGCLLCFLICTVYLSQAVIIHRRTGQGRSSCEEMSCCNESRSWVGSANPITVIASNL